MKNKQFYSAFTQKYDKRIPEIITEIKLSKSSYIQKKIEDKNFLTFRGLWDTGAPNTVISKKVVQELQLLPIEKAKVGGIHTHMFVDCYDVNIILPHITIPINSQVSGNIIVENIKVVECEINTSKNIQVDVLIGMNIILFGDFAISNCDGKTTFSFSFPSYKKPTDYVKRNNAVNPRIK